MVNYIQQSPLDSRQMLRQAYAVYVRKLTTATVLEGAAARPREASGIACETPSARGRRDFLSCQPLFLLQDSRSKACTATTTIASIKKAAAAVAGKMHSALTYQPVAQCSVCRTTPGRYLVNAESPSRSPRRVLLLSNCPMALCLCPSSCL